MILIIAILAQNVDFYSAAMYEPLVKTHNGGGQWNTI
jgi:hypothetical protein